jgi:hypothetical protein
MSPIPIRKGRKPRRFGMEAVALLASLAKALVASDIPILVVTR